MTWSLDSGAGLDDVCLFFTDQGEIAVYEGTDPDSPSTWALVGVYRIGKPLHENAWFRAGGDIAVVTRDGIVPVSAALKQDRAALKGSAITYPIEEAWRQIVSLRGSGAFPFSVTLWHSETMLVVGVPTFGYFDAVCFVANARTGAWARYTGWDSFNRLLDRADVVARAVPSVAGEDHLFALPHEIDGDSSVHRLSLLRARQAILPQHQIR